jgi:hypothetical protein
MICVGSLALAGVASACSSNSSRPTAPEDGGADGSCTTLTIYDFESSCKVSIDGGAPSAAAKTSVCVAPFSELTLVASAASAAFELGPNPWVGTNEPVSVIDSGSSSPTSTAGITVDGTTPGCLLVCCPHTDGTGCYPTQSGYSEWLQNCPGS